MPSVRSLIILAALIFVASIAGAWLSLFREPDSEGRGADTYGTQGDGYGAVFQVLQELDVVTKRKLTPPVPLGSEVSIVLLQPDRKIAGTEPVYLKRLLHWVESGGRLVVTLPRTLEVGKYGEFDMSASLPLPSVLETLELGEVTTEVFSAVPAEARRRSRQLDDESITDELEKVFGPRLVPPREVNVKRSGSLETINVHRLAVPGDTLQTLNCEKKAPRGKVDDVTDQDHVRTLVAEFERGRGSITIVSDHAVFQNRMLARCDNSVLAFQLFSPSGQPVIFDEFYHGLGVRGNPLYLMTRPGYAGLFLGIILLTSVWVWRQAVLLGPSIADDTVPRRDVNEYLSAMGRFFSSGREAKGFLVEKMRTGVLREVSRNLNLPPETNDIDLIAGVMARRTPRAAERFRQTIANVDQFLDKPKSWKEAETLDAMRRLTDCLSTNT